MAFSSRDVAIAYNRIRANGICRTPVLQSKCIDALAGKSLFFKSEHLQTTGSFKTRGAFNALLRLREEHRTSGEPLPGVITQSSGNHGQALAYASQLLGIKCTIVVPENAPKCKCDAIAAYGATLVRCASTMTARLEKCQTLADDQRLVIIDPHNDYAIMAGQGTVAVELLEQVDRLDAIVVPIGGGGLVSGIAAWVNQFKPDCKVICVEPSGKQLERSLLAGRPLWDADGGQLLDTVADGIRVQRVGDKCFPVILEHCHSSVLTVTDAEIISAMKLVWSRMKQTIEPTSATGLAAVLSPDNQQLLAPYKRIALILCGGNVDLDRLPWMGK